MRPQKAGNPDAVYISPAEYLSMRDYDTFSRVVIDDWKLGSGQITYDPRDPSSRARFYDSNGVDVSREAQLSCVRDFASRLDDGSTDTTTGRRPLLVAGDYLYYGAKTSVRYSSSQTFASPSTANSLDVPNDLGVWAMATDGQYVYAAFSSGGTARIQRFTIGATTAGTNFATPAGATRALIYANRILYHIDQANVFSEISLAGTITAKLTLPSGWTMVDICALRGGAIDAPILVLARQSNIGGRGAIWYWDGTTIHDYMALPTAFIPETMKEYLGVVYISGSVTDVASTNKMTQVLAIVNGTLTNLGYVAALPQSSGAPAELTEGGSNGPIDMVFHGNAMYIGVYNRTRGRAEIWTYDLVTGGWTRHFRGPATDVLVSHLAIFRNQLFYSLQPNGTNGKLYGNATTFVSSATLDQSDVNLGQPWASNLWAKIELVFDPLAAGESVAVAYSVDGGATYTSTDAAGTTMSTSTLNAKSATWLISNRTTSQKSPYIRPRVTLTAGTSQLTTPKLRSIALKAIPVDPAGVVIEAWLACSDQNIMPNGAPDWQGGSASERLYNIKNLYETGSLVTVIYMAPGSTRAKNPTTLSCRIDDYEILGAASSRVHAGGGPPIGIEGDVRVVLREVQ